MREDTISGRLEDFLLTRPAAAVVVNVEADHLENHGDLAGIVRAFEQFVDRTDPIGSLLVCAADDGARGIGEYARARRPRAVTSGVPADADARVRINAFAFTPALFDACDRIDPPPRGEPHIVDAVPALPDVPPPPSPAALPGPPRRAAPRRVRLPPDHRHPPL